MCNKGKPRGKGKLLPLSLLLFISLIMASNVAFANSITFSDYGLTNQKILLYNTTTLVGEYNTSSTINLDPDQNYVATFAPNTFMDFIGNPLLIVQYLSTLYPFGFDIAIGLLILAGVILLFKRIL